MSATDVRSSRRGAAVHRLLVRRLIASATVRSGQALAQGGYRSFAWPGPLGTRIVTNPLDPGGSEGSNRATYLRFDGTAFERMPGGGGNFRRSGAFSSAESGWLEADRWKTRETPPRRTFTVAIGAAAPLAA